MKRICVTGGRNFNQRQKVYDTLSAIHAEDGISVIIHGGATGADTLAADWATQAGVMKEEFAVTKDEWQRVGPSAGPIRNGRMLLEGRPDMLVAFEGGTGTLNCIGQASNLKIVVRVIV